MWKMVLVDEKGDFYYELVDYVIDIFEYLVKKVV